MKRVLKIAVLMGGISEERRVSLKSGMAVADALQKAGHAVTPFDVVDTGLKGLRAIGPDLAFIALHGRFGEDGEVQRLLGDMRIPYTGSGAEASRLGMDKVESKRLFVRNSIQTADYFVVEEDQQEAEIASWASALGYPLVCKPARSGSSLGVRIVRREDDLFQALQAALKRGPTALVERCVRGREFTVGILENCPLPMIELRPKREFFDYLAKYEDDSTEYITPVALIESLYRKAMEASVRAFECLGCRHFGRVDLIYGYDGTLHIMEVNTIPGFTERSLLPLAAAQVGIDFVSLCDRIAQLATVEAEEKELRRRAG